MSNAAMPMADRIEFENHLGLILLAALALVTVGVVSFALVRRRILVYRQQQTWQLMRRHAGECFQRALSCFGVC